MSRYNKGEAAYLNCPMNEEEYNAFYEALRTAETAEVHGFEEGNVFEGCMPVEVMAQRGKDTMRFGPMKPVGLPDPRTGKEPYAVVQLRQDNEEDTMYNIVGFQTHLKWGEQKRVFGMIPGLAGAEFVRYGVMHRNTYIHSPNLLEATMETRARKGLFYSAFVRAAGKEPRAFPQETAIGALCHYISHFIGKDFQPMNVNFGLLPPLPERVKKREKNEKLAVRALSVLDAFIKK